MVSWLERDQRGVVAAMEEAIMTGRGPGAIAQRFEPRKADSEQGNHERRTHSHTNTHTPI